ncbi:Ada metal-binding domain-containing protein [Vibrio sonorensis]|uniref:Ada metal-binding domain-containing protein n=1 Tax=Vibrio sonorensis TaxID=1004316 RepID=UPI0008DA49B4|nr:Ada metal-binding domain-containing protein [Vibrio sonorensis]
MFPIDQPLNRDQCQKARMARDARFDGAFYIAVKTTNIFCRPICPANLPKEENVEYFHDQSQALNAGYRPCLRCRPDSAPRSYAWKGVETTFERAINLIEQGALREGSLSQLAERLGISDRYLRQLFKRYLGVSPKQYALYHQLMFAKQLLHQSKMSITDIAFASGFRSVRRFNDAFLKTLQLSPSQIRGKTAVGDSSHQILLTFKGRIDWDRTLDFYRLRAVEGIEKVDDVSYERHACIGDTKAWIRVQKATDHSLLLEYKIEDITRLNLLVRRVRRVFDLDVDLTSVEKHLLHVSPKLVRYSGIRIPGVWSTWEAGVRAILGQQVSVKAAITHLNHLVSNLGDGDNHAFPTPQQVRDGDVSFLKMPNSRKETLQRLASWVCDNPEGSVSDWLTLKGIGPWTVNYALLRGQSESNRFLSDDLVVKHALKKFPELNAETVSPWGSYATLHCWSHA